MNSFKYNLARRFSGALLVFHMGFRPQMVFARIYTFPNQQYVDRIFENKYTDIKMHTTTVVTKLPGSVFWDNISNA